jgi:hypothetical protein
MGADVAVGWVCALVACANRISPRTRVAAEPKQRTHILIFVWMRRSSVKLFLGGGMVRLGRNVFVAFTHERKSKAKTPPFQKREGWAARKVKGGGDSEFEF